MGLDYEMQLTMSGVLNVCQVVACLWSLWGMDRFGRRKLLLGGGVCMVSDHILVASRNRCLNPFFALSWLTFSQFLSHFIIAILVGLYHNSWPTHTAAAWTSVAFLLFFMLTFGATW
jgi:hypothetical protein